MGERQRPAEMATTSTAVTLPAQTQEEPPARAVITLRPQTQERKKVVWTDDTVDNENMNKKKSKCCCIYEKPRKFDESESESSDDECDHCFGHVERRHRHAAAAAAAAAQPAAETVEGAKPPAVEVTLQPSGPTPAPPDKQPST